MHTDNLPVFAQRFTWENNSVPIVHNLAEEKCAPTLNLKQVLMHSDLRMDAYRTPLVSARDQGLAATNTGGQAIGCHEDTKKSADRRLS